MSKRTALGENPLDLIVPKEQTEADDQASSPTEEPAASEGAKESPAGAEAASEPPRQTLEPAAPRRAPAGQYLTFDLGGEEYGAGILQIKEIINYTETTPVPQTPPWIRGVINLRGSVVPIVDLSRKFGLEESKIGARTCIVLVDVLLETDDDSTVLGVLADAVKQVVDLGDDEIEPPPNFGTQIHVDYMLGMGRVDDRFIPLLDLDRVLTLSELTEVTSVQEAEAADEVTEVAGEPAELDDSQETATD